MKKKLTILSLALAISAFSTVSLSASYASDYDVSSENSSPLISANANGAAVEPQAIASLARKAVQVGKAAYEANKDALREATRLGSLLGTGVSSSDVENADVIFDK
ncbi:hypothetical protein ABEW32_25655 [Paenibacillus jamilae]|uniref:hypothetical protein n=1 Tax=Paenibacillus jamilae TaxID=114136 RepID=UPI003D2D4027